MAPLLSPKNTAAPHSSGTKVTKVTPTPLTAAESSELNSILSVMRDKTRRSRILLHPLFHDFDRHRLGTVTVSQFGRVLHTIGFNLTHSSVELLTRQYQLLDDSQLMDYKRFLTDIDHMGESSAAEAKAAALTADEASRAAHPISRTTVQEWKTLDLQPVFLEPNFASILNKCQTVLRQRRLHLNDLCSDFDPLRSGVITVQRFKRCLAQSGLGLSEDETRLVAEHYQDALPSDADAKRAMEGTSASALRGATVPVQRTLHYRRFINDVNGAFIPLEPETNPTRELSSFAPWRVETENEVEYSQLSPAEKERIQSILDELSYVSYTHRILIKPDFHHFDRTNHGEVTQRQFQSCIGKLFPTTSLTATDHKLLAIRFKRGHTSNDGNDLINYDAFCRELDALESVVARESVARIQQQNKIDSNTEANSAHSLAAQNRTVTQKSLQQTRTVDANEFVESLKSKLHRQRIGMEGIFRDFDSLNKGYITEAVFARCLSGSGVNLSPTEVQMLAEKYEVKNNPDLADVKSRYVNYKQFTDDLSFVPKQ